MALVAGCTEAPLVLILVAARAAGPETEVRGRSAGVGLVVALLAGHGLVAVLERPPRLRVVQLLGIPPDEARVAPEVVRVAALAGFSFVLAAVEPLAGADASPEVAVALVDAARRVDALAGGVAVVAPVVAFGAGVRLRQRPRRQELRTRRQRQEERAQKNDERERAASELAQ